MALQIWLPLNGNVTNQGLADGIYSTANIAYASTGKTAPQSLSTGTIKTKKTYQNYNGTVCFWIYVLSSAGTFRIIGNNDMTASVGNRKWSLFAYPTRNDLQVYGCMKDNVASANGNYILSGVLPDNTWTHVAVSHDTQNEYVYINGELKKTVSWDSSGVFTFDVTTELIPSISGRYLQDVRVYDHCLSPREVREIAKGIICHYPLCDIHSTTSVNKYKGDNFDGKCSSGSFTVTKLSDERGYNYSASYTGTGSNTRYLFCFPTYSFTVGKTYDYSFKARVRKMGIAISLRASRCHNDWETKAVNINNADGEWHEYHVRQTMSGTTFTLSGTTKTTAPELEVYTDNMATSGTVYEFDFDIKDVQVCECSVSAPVNSGTFATSNVYDVSGLKNHGALKNVTWSDGAPRYGGCYQFDGTSYVAAPQTTKVTDAITASVWAYADTWGSDVRLFSCTEVGGWNIEYLGGYINFSVFLNGAYSTCLSDKKWSDLSSGWHLFAVTFDGTTQKLYIDGKLDTTKTAASSKSPITYNSTNTIFLGAEAQASATTPTSPYFKGKMSDFRLYATALSAADVLELYNTPITITNGGAIMTQGEFKEG